MNYTNHIIIQNIIFIKNNLQTPQYINSKEEQKSHPEAKEEKHIWVGRQITYVYQKWSTYVIHYNFLQITAILAKNS